MLSAPAILIGADATLFDALVLMRTHNVSGLPVVDSSGTVVGVLSEKDLSRIVAGSPLFPEIRGLLDVLMVGLVDQPTPSLRELRQRLEDSRVEEAMSSPPFVIGPDAPLEAAAEVMSVRRINRLPVVDGHRLVGVISRTDLVRAMVPTGPFSPSAWESARRRVARPRHLRGPNPARTRRPIRRRRRARSP